MSHWLVRLLKHRRLDETDVQRVLGAGALQRIQARVSASERRHSSEIRVVERGPEPVDEVRGWLRSELSGYFSHGSAEFTHDSWIQVFRLGVVTPLLP